MYVVKGFQVSVRFKVQSPPQQQAQGNTHEVGTAQVTRHNRTQYTHGNGQVGTEQHVHAMDFKSVVRNMRSLLANFGYTSLGARQARAGVEISLTTKP